MAGVGGLSSLGLFLLLLLASSSAAREERSSRTGWETVTQGAFNYLVLLKVGAEAKCSGSIPSKWTVLTFCEDVTEASKTKAYAGLVKVDEAVDEPKKGIQKRDVKSVAANDKQKDLKICTLDKNWDLDNNVGIVDLFVQTERGPIADCTLLGFGGTEGAQKLVTQTLGGANCGTGAEDSTEGVIHSKLEQADLTKKELKPLDKGGPAVCGTKQRGINKKFIKATSDADGGCNWFLDVAEFSPWIEDQIKAADAAGESGGTGGTGGNGTSPSSGYSIHSYVNKYSNWKVLGFLVPTIVTFLQY